MDFSGVYKDSVDERFKDLNGILSAHNVKMESITTFDKALYEMYKGFNKAIDDDNVIPCLLEDIFAKKFGSTEVEAYMDGECFYVREMYGKKTAYVSVAFFEDKYAMPLSICVSADKNSIDVTASDYRNAPNVRTIKALNILGNEIYYSRVLYTEIYKALKDIVDTCEDNMIISTMDDDEFQDEMDYQRTGHWKSEEWLKRYPIDEYPVKYDYSNDN